MVIVHIETDDGRLDELQTNFIKKSHDNRNILNISIHYHSTSVNK